jgi:hypothetical protein
VACAVAILGCVADGGSDLDIPEADLVVFTDEVQPVLAEDCSTDSCHGRLDRPLGLYAVGAARLDAEDGDSDNALTPEEIELNHQRAQGFLLGVEDPDACLLLSKPLPVADGGTVHDPGPVFNSAVDHRYVAVLDWVELALEDGDP